MSNPGLEQFSDRKYLNLESYRKNGEAVRTPLWYAQQAQTLYVYTGADTWKVKRVRKNPRIRIVPCSMRGAPEGEWIEARVRFVQGEEEAKGRQLLDRKYGWQKRLIDWSGKLRKTRTVVMAIEMPENGEA